MAKAKAKANITKKAPAKKWWFEDVGENVRKNAEQISANIQANADEIGANVRANAERVGDNMKAYLNRNLSK